MVVTQKNEKSKQPTDRPNGQNGQILVSGSRQNFANIPCFLVISLKTTGKYLRSCRVRPRKQL
jgi:hypothetical protein